MDSNGYIEEQWEHENYGPWHKVYKIEFENKAFYLGRTLGSLEDRLRTHEKNPCNPNLHYMMLEGYSYEIKELDRFLEQKDAMRFEKLIILKSHADLELRPYLLNIYAGGTKLIPSLDHRDKIDWLQKPMFRVKPRKVVIVDPTASYRCSRCHVRKNSSEFYKDRTRFNGLHSRCKKCAHELQRERRKVRKKKFETIGDARYKGTKKCSRCKEYREKKLFHINNNTFDGLNYTCMICKYENYRLVTKKIIEKNKALGDKLHIGTKKCGTCQEYKSKKLFHKSYERKDGLQKRCIACGKAIAFKWRLLREGIHYGDLTDNGLMCTLCNTFKPQSEFQKRKTGLMGRHSRCRDCARAYLKAWRAKQKEKLNQQTS